MPTISGLLLMSEYIVQALCINDEPAHRVRFSMGKHASQYALFGWDFPQAIRRSDSGVGKSKLSAWRKINGLKGRDWIMIGRLCYAGCSNEGWAREIGEGEREEAGKETRG